MKLRFRPKAFLFLGRWGYEADFDRFQSDNARFQFVDAKIHSDGGGYELKIDDFVFARGGVELKIVGFVYDDGGNEVNPHDFTFNTGIAELKIPIFEPCIVDIII